MRDQPEFSYLPTMPHQWRELPSGLRYQSTLQAHLNHWWPQICGSHLLKLGELSIDLSSERCMAVQQVSLPLLHCHHSETVGGMGNMRLPFSSGWFDACLLAHTLAYADNPHDVLREADRVLTDQGWLLISGFSPWSLLGIGKLLPILRQQQLYGSRLLSCRRVVDWLYLLNYRVLSQHAFQALPWKGAYHTKGLLGDCLSLFGCQYLIVARKHTIPLQPIQARMRYWPLWQKPVGVCGNTLNGDISDGYVW